MRKLIPKGGGTGGVAATGSSSAGKRSAAQLVAEIASQQPEDDGAAAIAARADIVTIIGGGQTEDELLTKCFAQAVDARNAKISNSWEYGQLASRLGDMLCRLCVATRMPVDVKPLRRLTTWYERFNQDRADRIQIYSNVDCVLYRGSNRIVGYTEWTITNENSLKLSIADALPDEKQDELDALRDTYRLGGLANTEIKGSSYTTYAALIHDLIKRHDIQKWSCDAEYLRLTVAAVYLTMRIVGRTFAGSLMLNVLTRLFDDAATPDAEPQVHWMPDSSSADPISLSIINASDCTFAPFIRASSSLAFKRHVENDGDAVQRFKVQLNVSMDPSQVVARRPSKKPSSSGDEQCLYELLGKIASEDLKIPTATNVLKELVGQANLSAAGHPSKSLINRVGSIFVRSVDIQIETEARK